MNLNLKEKKIVILLEKPLNGWVTFSEGSGKVIKEFTINEMSCLNKDKKYVLIFFLLLD